MWTKINLSILKIIFRNLWRFWNISRRFRRLYLNPSLTLPLKWKGILLENLKISSTVVRLPSIFKGRIEDGFNQRNLREKYFTLGKIYFASDFHLMPDTQERERKIVRWLDFIKADAEAIYLVGDVFDFWFEYGTVIPKGYVRFFGKLAELRDSGIPIYFFTGNHDMWMFRYFETELDIPIYRQPIIREIKGKQFFIGHGDGLGPGDYTYKRLKKVFNNRICQWLFGRLHPDYGVKIASFASYSSRKHKGETGYTTKEKEWLYAYATRKSKEIDVDYFVFGHRHIPMNLQLPNGKTRYINTGEWFNKCSYLVVDDKEVKLQFFENDELNQNWKSPN